MKTNNMEINTTKEISTKLKVFDHLAKDNDYISITEWSNGEGWTISSRDKLFDLTIGELEAINYLTKVLEYHEKL